MRKPRVWFWGPEVYWYGWQTLLPINVGFDEYDRHTVVLGWTFSGRMVVALWTAA